MSDNAKLKLCPFCGELAKVEARTDKKGEYYRVGCFNSHCRINPRARRDGMAQAIDAWNDRKETLWDGLGAPTP